MMNLFDLCLAWNWEYDTDFVRLLETSCQSKGISLLQITPENLNHILYELEHKQIAFRFLWDRASEVDERFLALANWALKQNVHWINHNEKAARTWNKAALHHILIKAGLHTPYTIILPSFAEHSHLEPINLNLIGERFIIKPAHGSGGVGVVMEANSMEEVLRVRQEHPTDLYLLQNKIVPRDINSRPAWFRNIYCRGRAYLCWWDPYTHIYTPLSPEEEEQNGLHQMHDMVLTIAKICELDLFSTEIAYTYDDLFVVVDYVNDEIDLRLKSNAIDGVPDQTVHDIINRLTDFIGLKTNLITYSDYSANKPKSITQDSNSEDLA